jgi:hypothetical protein
MMQAYGYRLPEEDIQELYEMIDNNKSGRISIDEFFTLCEILEDSNKFQFDKLRPPKFWEDFRAYVNDILNLREVIEGPVSLPHI